MKKVTVEEFQENWDEMIRKVEGGESIEITDGKGSAVMIPACSPVRLGTWARPLRLRH